MAFDKQASNFSRLDYFLVSYSFLNQIRNYKIQPGFMSDHSLISLDLNLTKTERGKVILR